MHVLWKYNREVCTKKSCLLCQLKGKRPPQLWRQTGMLDRMLRHVDCFLSPSRFTLRKHLEMGLDIPIQQMPYFLPTPEENGNGAMVDVPTRPFFLFVGRLEYIKGVQNLIPIFKERPEFDLLVTGDGTYAENLKEQAKGVPNIKFLGRLDQERLKSLYRFAIAVIVPSICYETFGIIVIEAFSQRTPVIVNDLGALPEVVEDSRGGFVYKTPTELNDAMDKLASNSKLRTELGENGHAAFMRYWNEEAHLKQYLGLVERLLEQKREALSNGADEKAMPAVSV
jgi:glycosyltransferase involved in cell wall biosynthesis